MTRMSVFGSRLLGRFCIGLVTGLALLVSSSPALAADQPITWAFSLNGIFNVQVGDTLSFFWPGGAHDVAIVPDQTAYDTCDLSNAVPLTAVIPGPHTAVVNVTAPGTVYYVCTVLGHCAGGIKAAVTATGVAAVPSIDMVGGSILTGALILMALGLQIVRRRRGPAA